MFVPIKLYALTVCGSKIYYIKQILKSRVFIKYVYKAIKKTLHFAAESFFICCLYFI